MEKKKRVVVFGIFDGIHDGHRDFFRQAKEQGDELLVIVGRDSASLKWKGKKPYHPEQERLSLVLREELVNGAVLGDEEQSTYRVLQNLNPDLICLGYDQQKLREDLKIWFAKEQRSIPCLLLKPYHSAIYHNSKLNHRE